MTKDKALYKYFNDFMPAYVSTSVPDDVALPFMTYEYITAGFNDEGVMITVNLWFRSESEAIPNKKADEFRSYILENPMVKCDEGYVWVKPGTPWCQALTDETDRAIKRRYINVTLEYFTN